MGKVAKLRFSEHKEATEVRLDLGAGKGQRTPPGFTPVDKHAWEGVECVNLTQRWPWKDNSVDEVLADYLLHYLTPSERVHFFNELHRVLKPESRAVVIVPYWCGNKEFHDGRVQWPPFCEAHFSTLSKAWRAAQNWVDDTGLACDFEFVCGYGMHPAMESRSEEYVRNAAMFYKDAVQDLHVTLTKR